MNRSNFHNEENFWPCVSDMFLALFVIALVLYSGMSQDKGKGDEYISDLVEEEACSLLETLKNTHPEAKAVQDINLASIRSESGKNRPELTNALYALLDCEQLDGYFVEDHLPERKPANERRYTDAIVALYMATSEDGKTGPAKYDPSYHNHMREVRERIERRIMLESGPPPEVVTLEELQAEVEKLREMLKNSVTKSSYDDLKSQYDDLLKNSVKKSSYDDLKRQYDDLWSKYHDLLKSSPDVARMQQEMERLRKELQAASAELARVNKNYAYTVAAKDAQIAERDAVIQSMIDLRVNVMDQIEKLLNSHPFNKLLHAGVEVHKREGLIIIPSSVFAFPKATDDYYRQGNGIVTADLEKRLENKLKAEHRENMRLLAQFLDYIGALVEEGTLPVDNISIECHTDDDVSKIKDKKFYNDGLSLQRSFDAWRLLDKYAEGKLAQYRNSEEQGLFSMTGFGMRVLPEKIPGESKAAYEERCRRMQIRFNCSPQKQGNESH